MVHSHTHVAPYDPLDRSMWNNDSNRVRPNPSSGNVDLTNLNR